MLLHLTVVENDHTGVSVVLLLHLVFGIDALPLDLGTRKNTNIYVSNAICDASSRERQQKRKFRTQDRQHASVHEFIRADRIKLLMRPLLTNGLLNLLVRQLVQCFC